jgi:hypothetical protein
MRINNEIELGFFVLVSALTLFSPPLAGGQNGHGENGHQNGQGQNGGNRGAHAPLIGASLPALAIGYGVFWLIRRRRTIGPVLGANLRHAIGSSERGERRGRAPVVK